MEQTYKWIDILNWAITLVTGQDCVTTHIYKRSSTKTLEQQNEMK